MYKLSHVFVPRRFLSPNQEFLLYEIKDHYVGKRKVYEYFYST